LLGFVRLIFVVVTTHYESLDHVPPPGLADAKRVVGVKAVLIYTDFFSHSHFAKSLANTRERGCPLSQTLDPAMALETK